MLPDDVDIPVFIEFAKYILLPCRFLNKFVKKKHITPPEF